MDEIAVKEVNDKPNDIMAERQMKINKFLNGNWIQAAVDENNAFVSAPVSRGGWYSMVFSDGQKVAFNSPMNCGFGNSRAGTFDVNTFDNKMNFHFTQLIGYGNSQEKDGEIEQKESYYILRIEENGFMLQDVTDESKVLTLKRNETEEDK